MIRTHEMQIPARWNRVGQGCDGVSLKSIEVVLLADVASHNSSETEPNYHNWADASLDRKGVVLFFSKNSIFIFTLFFRHRSKRRWVKRRTLREYFDFSTSSRFEVYTQISIFWIWRRRPVKWKTYMVRCRCYIKEGNFISGRTRRVPDTRRNPACLPIESKKENFTLSDFRQR